MGGEVPPDEFFGDGLPLVAVQFVGLEQTPLVLRTPETVINFRVEVVVPSVWGAGYLSLHCFPVLSNSVSAQSFSEMRGHFLVPNLETSRTIC